MCDACQFGPIGDRKHGEETYGTEQKDWLNDALVQK